MPGPNKIFTFDPHKNRKVYVGDLYLTKFVKKVKRSKHYLYMVKGYAIQTEVILQLGKTPLIEFQEIDAGHTYQISMQDFMMHSRPWSHGHGPQLAISEKYLHEESKL